MDGPEDFISSSMKCVSLDAAAFTVPKEHTKESDEFDIAWIELPEYFQRKREEGVQLGWSLDDLPKQTFYTCAIPEKHGALDGFFQICGNENFLMQCIYILSNDSSKSPLRIISSFILNRYMWLKSVNPSLSLLSLAFFIPQRYRN